MAIEKAAAYHDLLVETEFGYAQAIKTGDTISLSGQVSLDPNGSNYIVGAGDIEAQVRQVYA